MTTTVPQLLKPVYFKYPRGKLLCYPPILCIVFCYHCPYLQLFFSWGISESVGFRSAPKQEFPEAGVPLASSAGTQCCQPGSCLRWSGGWSGGWWDVCTPLKPWWLFHSHFTEKELVIVSCLKRKFCSKPSADPSRLCTGPIPSSRVVFFPWKHGSCLTETAPLRNLPISCQSHHYGNRVPNTILT